jgi:xylulokinase
MSRFTEQGIAPEEIRVTGGGSGSPVWRQIVADVFGVSTVGLSTTEGAAFGSALQAAWMCEDEEITSLAERLVRTDEATRAEPNRENRDLYANLLARQSQMTTLLHRGGYL